MADLPLPLHLLLDLGVLSALVVAGSALPLGLRDRTRRAAFGGLCALVALLLLLASPGQGGWPVPLLLAGPFAGIAASGAAILAVGLGGALLSSAPPAVLLAGCLAAALGAAALLLDRRRGGRLGILGFALAGAAVGGALLGARAWLTGETEPAQSGAGALAVLLEASGAAALAGFLLRLDERRRRALAQAESAAEAAERARVRLLSHMNHELRTPLTGQLGMLDLLRDAELSPTHRTYLDALETASRTLQDVVDDLLDYSQIETRRLELADDDIEVPSLAEAVVTGFQPLADERGIALRLRVAAGSPERLRSDPQRLKQILSNLVGSALALANHGFVELRVGPDGSGRAPELLFDVVASGLAIEPARRASFFAGEALSPGAGQGASDSEETAARSPDRPGAADVGLRRGAGLRLQISSRLAELMGGRLSVEARRDGEGGKAGSRGSQFRLRLPLVPPDRDRPRQPALEGAPAEGAPAGPAAGAAAPDDRAGRPLSGLRILVAEDSAVTRLLLGDMLAKLGAETHLVNDGQMAVTAARVGRFDLVLMDMQMPILDGVEATRAIRALGGPWESLPILALTADVVPENQRAYYGAGLDGVLHKPVDWAELIATVALVRSSVRRSVPDAAPAGEAARDPEGALQALLDKWPTFDPASQRSLARSLGGERLAEIADLWPGFAGEYMAAIEAARKAGDGRALARAAHSIKGTAGYLGYARLEALCLFAQRAARDSSLVESLAPELRREIGRTLDHFGQGRAGAARVSTDGPEQEPA